MKICWDGLGLYGLKGTGLNSYSYGLINSLLEKYPQCEYSLVWDDSALVNEWQNKVRFIPLKLGRTNDNYMFLEDYLKYSKINIYHSLNNGFSLPKRKICNYVITVHELFALHNKKYVDAKYMKKFDSVFPRVLQQADKIIAVSDHIKKDLITYFNLPQSKIAVISPGCYLPESSLQQTNSKNYLKYRYNLQNNFILYVGSIHPRKNLRSLIYTFKQVKGQYPNLKLVIVGKTDGKRSDYYKSLVILTKQLGIENSVIFTGAAPQEDVYFFYKECLCTVNLTDYDGFPMTLPEAAACGAPVICSTSPSIQEVAADSCIQVDIRDDKALKEALLEMIFNEKYRNEAIISSRNLASEYTWDRSADKLIKLYESFI